MFSGFELYSRWVPLFYLIDNYGALSWVSLEDESDDSLQLMVDVYKMNLL